MVSPSAVLGVDPDADESTIRRAFRERVKEVHPDQGGSVEEFQLVKRAYAALRERDRNGNGDVADLDADERGTPDGWDDAAGGGSDGEGDGTADVEPVRVEFLDYAVVDDYGWGLDDPDLFERAAAADLDPADYGRLLAEPTESLLEAAEARGYTWPFSCRGGACANCAVYLASGELSQPANHILPDELADRGFRLSCNGYPITDELQVVFNVKHLPELDELKLPPGPFRRARSE